VDFIPTAKRLLMSGEDYICSVMANALLGTKRRTLTLQFMISFGLVLLVAFSFYLSVDLIGYKIVALVLLMAVSLLAMVFDIIPVLSAAVLSAVLWNFLFIPPIYNFTIDTPEDALLFMMYFVVALVNAVLTSKIRKAESEVRARDERAASIRLYNTLLNSLSHELRTPIATIVGAVDTLKESPSKLSDDQRTALLSEIDIAGMRLNGQVENLLNMSRLESGFIQPKMDWCDISEMVHSVIRSNTSAIYSHQIKFSPPDDFPIFKIDRGLIEPVLQNLLQNALIYTPAGTTVQINLSHTDHSFSIEILDDGPGVPSEKMNKVFDKFYRLPNMPTGGTGLGLSIVKGFVEAHNGSVRLENVQPHGAKFTIEIPAESSLLKPSEDE
jgi:two-component system sensor histidine kinase KdpD